MPESISANHRAENLNDPLHRIRSRFYHLKEHLNQNRKRPKELDFSGVSPNMVQAEFGTAVQKNEETRRPRTRSVNQNPPRSTKKARTIVPPPQSARIIQRYAGGESIRQIAREEQRDRATVTKIVRSDEMQGFVQRMRERFYGFAFDAMNSVEHSLKQQKDARLAYRILTDIGIVLSERERYSIATQPPSIDKSTMTPLELAMAEDEDGSINRVAYGAACVMEESARVFGTELPTEEEYRHGCRVAQVADEITNGRFAHISLTSGAEEKRIRESAEKIVRREDARKSLPPHRTPRKLRQKKQRTLAS
jgi:hypothetical protein